MRPVAAVSGYGPDPGDVFVDYRASGRRWRLFAVVAGVLVVVLVAGYLVRATFATPEAAVGAYFTALAERDPAAALRHLAPEVASPAEAALLDPRVLASPDYQPPENVEVLEATVDGREAAVTVSYTVAGRVRNASMRLRRADGVADAILHRWLVVDGIGSIIVTEAPEEILVNGEPVAAYDRQGPRILPALPGGYRVAVPAGDPMWEERASLVDVAPQRAEQLQLPLVARVEVREEVNRQVVRLLDACAASEEAIPPGCPFGYARLLRVDDVQWRIARYPAIRLTATMEAGGPVIAVASARDGEAVLTGTTSFGRPLEVTVAFPVAGIATVRGTTVVFRPEW